jgi:hypothetical protein
MTSKRSAKKTTRKRSTSKSKVKKTPTRKRTTSKVVKKKTTTRTSKSKVKKTATRKRTTKRLIYPKPVSVNNYGEVVPAGEAPSKQLRRLGRPSPSLSATLASVGTKMTGNDGRMYVVKSFGARNIQRWVLYK